MSGTDEPITLNLTEDAMALIWGVVEEIVRLTNIHAGRGGSGAGGRGGRSSFSDSSGCDDAADYDDDDDDEVRDIFELVPATNTALHVRAFEQGIHTPNQSTLNVATGAHQREERIGAACFGVRAVVCEIWESFVLLREALLPRDLSFL